MKANVQGKKLLCYLCLIFFLFLQKAAYGQLHEKTKHTLSVGLNRAFFGTGDIVGPALYAEYHYKFCPVFGIAPRLTSGYAFDHSDTRYRYAASFAGSVALRITPIPDALPWFGIEIGGLYHQLIVSHGTYFPQPSNGLVGYETTLYDNRLWGSWADCGLIWFSSKSGIWDSGQSC